MPTDDISTIETYLDRSGNDVDGWAAMWADDGRLELPFFPDPEFRVIEGIDTIHAQGEKVKGIMRSITFFDRVIRETVEPGTFVVEYSGDGELIDGGRYQNSYIVVAVIDAGRMKLWREYFNPNPRKQMSDIVNKD